MNLKNIINEEIEDFNKDLLNIEGVADKYAEKQFNISDPNRDKEQLSLTGLQQKPQDDKGELLGNTGGISKSNVYANPRTLKDFEANVRAVVDKEGNLFVAQLDRSFYHDNLVTTVNNSKGKYNKSLPNDAYYSYEDEVLLHRVGKTNMFGLSDSYETFASMYPEIVQDLLKIAENKNPQFKFYPKYYMDYKFFGDTNKSNNNKFTTNEDNENGKIDNNNEIGKIDNDNENGKIVEIVGEELNNFIEGVSNKNTAKFNDNFWKWFGSSKVVKNGKPLIMHHGGSFSPSIPQKGFTNPFNDFRGTGWFTAHKTGAKYYAKQSGGDVTSVYLKIENPLYAREQEDGSYIETNEAVHIAQKSNKYDGVIDRDDKGNVFDAIVWDSKQIKSIENNGEYNPSEPDVTKEGVADKYAEKSFNIQDPNTEMNRLAQQGLEKNPENGELVGIIKGREPKEYYGGGGKKQYPGTSDTQIYRNPKSLKNFEADVKALSNAEGNLYVALQDTDIYHAAIVNAVNDGNSGDNLDGAYIEDLNITWHRVGQTNDFGFSISYRDFSEMPDNNNIIQSLINAVKSKNPSFNFINEYWENIKDKMNGVNSNPKNTVKMVNSYSESKNFNAHYNGLHHNSLNTFHNG